MKVFLDANILVAVLCKEYPLYTHAAKLLSLADNRRYTLYTSAVCLAIAFYFAEKKHGAASARERMVLLSKHIRISACGEKEVQEAAANRKVNDFEDGLQYYAALHSGCKVIVTENRDDFYFSDKIEILTTYDFLKTYVVRNAW
ncbi:MAG: PIN domain-containing protein [Chitinophagaceae bacterium]|nr:PIN domain-containing protein [Chitinophagaceae bacterium]